MPVVPIIAATIIAIVIKKINALCLDKANIRFIQSTCEMRIRARIMYPVTEKVVIIVAINTNIFSESLLVTSLLFFAKEYNKATFRKA